MYRNGRAKTVWKVGCRCEYMYKWDILQIILEMKKSAFVLQYLLYYELSGEVEHLQFRLWKRKKKKMG
jgi:hypothetical protein